MAVTGFSEGVPPGVWVFIGIYLAGLLGLGVWYGHKNSKKDITPKDHFLAGKEMGVIVAMFSLYASSWSGYTEVGAPGEAYSQGWNFMRWAPGNVMFACWIGWLAPRVHFYSHRRNYEGTADFIADRYRNHALSIVAVTFSIIPVCFYIMGQLTGVGTTMSTMTGGELSPFVSALIFVFVMLFYEMAGGMAAIALTDVWQAGILLFGFCMYYILAPALFGGVPGSTDDFLNCARMYDDERLSFDFADMWFDLRGVDPDLFISGGISSAPAQIETKWWNEKEEYYNGNITSWMTAYATAFDKIPVDERVLTKDNNVDGVEYMTWEVSDSAWEKSEDTADMELSAIYMPMAKDKECPLTPGNVIEPAGAADHLTINNEKIATWVGFSIGSVPFIIYPHVMDRYYASKSVKVMKYALQLVHLSTWISAIPSVLIGYCVSTYADLTNIEDSNAVFANMVETIINENAFLYILGCLILSAAFAAYMSTADSGLMGFSSAVCLDLAKFYFPYFNDNSDIKVQNKRLIMLGKVTSVCAAFIALILTTWDALDLPLGDLYVYQGSFLFQVLPAYLLGFFIPGVCSYSVLTGLISGIISIITLNVGWADEVFADMPHVFWTLIINFGMIGVVEIILRVADMHPGFEPSVKKNFLCFDEMPIGYIGLDMSSVGGPKYEPFRPLWASALVIVLIYASFPYWAEKDDYEITYVGGVPWWAVVTFFLSAWAQAITMIQCHFYYDDWMTAADVAKTLDGDTANEVEMGGTAPSAVL